MGVSRTGGTCTGGTCTGGTCTGGTCTGVHVRGYMYGRDMSPTFDGSLKRTKAPGSYLFIVWGKRLKYTWAVLL